MRNRGEFRWWVRQMLQAGIFDPFQILESCWFSAGWTNCFHPLSTQYSLQLTRHGLAVDCTSAAKPWFSIVLSPIPSLSFVNPWPTYYPRPGIDGKVALWDNESTEDFEETFSSCWRVECYLLKPLQLSCSAPEWALDVPVENFIAFILIPPFVASREFLASLHVLPPY